MKTNNIGWCDDTINPIVGCSKCSPGCDNCYAERFAARLAKNPATAKKYAGVVDENGKWTGKINFCASKNGNDMPLDAPGKNKRVFVGSMSDFFHPNVSDDTRDVIFAFILCDHIRPKPKGHTFMILTKRAKEMRDYFSIGRAIVPRWWGDVEPDEVVTWPLPNLWLGVTVCNQAEADAKIPVLLDIPAARRFVSIEPMLGPVDLNGCEFLCKAWSQGQATLGTYLDWVICGGETGPGARPMHPEWARSLRDQCVAAGVPFYFKGWGEWRAGAMTLHRLIPSVRHAILKSGLPGILSANVYRIGKKRAGCLIDGKEWRQFPAQEAADVS